MIARLLLLARIRFLMAASAALAGNGNDKLFGGSYFHQHGYTRLPEEHLPPTGLCRVWYPNWPARRQPPPFHCSQPYGLIRPGGWLMVPGPTPQEMQVSVYDRRRPGVVVVVGIFDAYSGLLVRILGQP